MKAPDKIYVQRYSYGALVGGYSDKPKEMADGENITYIRKDALIEWIQEVRAIPHENAIVRDLAFQEVVNKLNSM